MTITDLQNGLLYWFWYEPNQLKNMRSIDNRCVNLYRQYYPNRDTYFAKDELFLPLLRSGVVEFYPEDRFRLSPSCILTSTKAVMFINAPAEVAARIAPFSPVKTCPGIVVYNRSEMSPAFLNALNLPISEFNFKQSCGLIPNFESVIGSWEKNQISDTTDFMFFDGQWKNGFEADRTGLYKKSDAVYAERVCKLKNNQWTTVPQREIHIDAFPIAMTWAKKTAGSGLYITYQHKQVDIKDIFFPLLLERLLVINSLLHPQCDWDLNKRTYFINEPDFNVLHKLLI